MVKNDAEFNKRIGFPIAIGIQFWIHEIEHVAKPHF
jgi:hypothetical protein